MFGNTTVKGYRSRNIIRSKSMYISESGVRVIITSRSSVSTSCVCVYVYVCVRNSVKGVHVLRVSVRMTQYTCSYSYPLNYKTRHIHTPHTQEPKHRSYSTTSYKHSYSQNIHEYHAIKIRHINVHFPRNRLIEVQNFPSPSLYGI